MKVSFDERVVLCPADPDMMQDNADMQDNDADRAEKGPALQRGMIALRGAYHPETLPRVLALFAQRSLVPTQLNARRTEEHLVIDIEFEHSDEALVDTLLGKLRALFLVERAMQVEGLLTD
ncbi:hypothetical protein D6851_12835 [Altericroceibacterium spongiae]|uniref:ACT domain-containing protein n=1 Tax=Altericroceibacterium spongiae TaxID=2320269 RepID=A0A420EF54_9SPHN|nr:hypothetical protein [Altericroceibacterium spongiae]RKF19331.1 hypothetical protein D6851_12835 [Altericroceibacterium spongiae]